MLFTIWLTYDCNMKCAYCYEGEDKRQTKLELETADDILTFIKSKIKDINRKIMINFHGGEPLMNYEVLEYLIRKVNSWENENISMLLTTNATLLDNNKIEFLTNNLDELSISIDGDKEAHDINRKFKNNIGSYESIIENIKSIPFGSKCNILGRMTITPETVHKLYDNIKFLVELGFKKIVPVLNQYDNRWSEHDKNVLLEEVKKVIDEFYVKKSGIVVGLVEEILYRKHSKCMAGKQTFHIGPEGDIYPCAHLMNVKSMKIGDVWNGVQENKIDEIQEINQREIPGCANCAWKDRCHGVRCKLINYAITGEFCRPAFVTCLNEHLLMEIHQYYQQVVK